MNYIIETENLLLREFDTSDSIFIIQLLNSPGWIEYIGDRNIKSEADAIDYLLNSPIKSYAEHGFGLFMVEKKENRIPLGMCGLIKRSTLDKPDIGYAFLPEYNGKGFAFESAVGVLNYAKVKLNIENLYAIILPNNNPSIKLIKKLGFHFIMNFNHDQEELMLFGN